MATSGYVDVNVTSNGYIKLRYKWTAGTQNIANNFTPVSWVLQLISTNSGANIISSASKNYSVTTNGTTKSGTNTVGINGGQTKTLASGSLNISHNSNGTKTFSFSFSQEFNITYSGVSIGTISGYGSGTLNTIPRGSTLEDISNFTLGGSINIPITKYSNSFTDTLVISLSGTTIKTINDIENGDDVTFTNSELNTIYGLLPNATSGTFTFKLTTKSGSTTIGTSTKTPKGSIPASVKPSISAITLTEAVEGIAEQFGAFIQNKSRATVNVTYTVGTGSSLNSIQIKLNGETLTSNNSTTNILNTAGSNTCSVTVTDSRGRTATATQNFNVVAYASPSVSGFTVVRCQQDGTLDDMGEYAKVNATATITALSNLNTKSFSLQYQQTGSGVWNTVATYTDSYTYTITNLIVPNISADNTYDFRIVATDFFGDTSSKVIELESGFSIIDLRNTGKGIAFGKVSTLDAMEIGMPIYDMNGTRILNGLAYYNNGYEDPNTCLEELILTQTNVPDTGFWYIRTVFYASKTVNSHRTQIAYPYNQGIMRIYARTYYNGAWSSWMAVNEYTNTAQNYVGNSLVGKTLSIQWGSVTITPAANTPTNQVINFGRTYQYAPLVIPVALTSSPGIATLGVSVISATTTQATLCITRTSTTPVPVTFVVIGKVV